MDLRFCRALYQRPADTLPNLCTYFTAILLNLCNLDGCINGYFSQGTTTTDLVYSNQARQGLVGRQIANVLQSI